MFHAAAVLGNSANKQPTATGNPATDVYIPDDSFQPWLFVLTHRMALCSQFKAYGCAKHIEACPFPDKKQDWLWQWADQRTYGGYFPPSSSKPKDIIHDDLCSICQDDVSILDITTHTLYNCCGKVMHLKCRAQLHGAKYLSVETRTTGCPLFLVWILAGAVEALKRY